MGCHAASCISPVPSGCSPAFGAVADAVAEHRLLDILQAVLLATLDAVGTVKVAVSCHHCSLREPSLQHNHGMTNDEAQHSWQYFNTLGRC